MGYKITPKDIEKIEYGLNKAGKTEVTLKVEQGNLTVLLVKKQKM